MNEIVKYHNEMNTINLGSFSPIEMDLFFVICSKIKNEKNGSTIFSFEELKSLSQYKQTSSKAFLRDIERTYQKYLTLNMREVAENGDIIRFVLFTKFNISPSNKTVEIKVNEEFRYILYDLINGSFTRFELEELVSLKSSYSKSLYRLLKQFRKSGFYTVKIEKFRELLEVPQSYDMKELTRRVLTPSMKEISPYFKNLKVEKIKARTQGNPIIGYNFIFDKEIVSEDENQEIKESGFICPDCGQPLIEKVINGNNCWCHADGWKKGATCNRIFNSVLEIRENEQKEDLEPIIETAEQTENKKKLSNFIGKLFK